MEAQAQPLPFRYEAGFMKSWLKKLVKDHEVAITEIIANGLDAGADTIEITVPTTNGKDEKLVFFDNGTGMTHDEFLERWQTLSYNRKKIQGDEITFPEGNNPSTRKPFGRNGKGRFSMFCFASSYDVRTCKDGTISHYQIKENDEAAESPYNVIPFGSTQCDPEEHWTEISTVPTKILLPSPRSIMATIAEQYLFDPAVIIKVNDKRVNLNSLDDYEKEERQIDTPIGPIIINFIKSEKPGKTAMRNGIAWWVNSKLVGKINWSSKLDGEKLFDARRTQGKKYTYIVTADDLESSVNDDWLGFDVPDDSDEYKAIQIVENEIVRWMGELRKTTASESRKKVLQDNIEEVTKLGYLGREKADRLLSGIQEEIPGIDEDELDKIVKLFVKLELTASGKELLSKLWNLSELDIEMLNEILANWEIIKIKTILDELGKRLELISTMEKVLNDPDADELHDIHPLFDQGLWIFGPEYETIEFTSNRAMSTVIHNLLERDGYEFANPHDGRIRPDIVACADSTILHYERDGFDDEKPSEFEKVLVIELKKGGSRITGENLYQAENYCLGILESGKVEKSEGCIVAYVLGDTIDTNRAKSKVVDEGSVKIFPCTFSAILRQAHNRTFKLHKKIKDAAENNGIDLSDPEIFEGIQEPLSSQAMIK